MAGSSRLRKLTLLAILLASTPVLGQTMGPVEAVRANGRVAQELALTAAQRNAIYNTVMQQRVRTAAPEVPLLIGAPVPATLELHQLPHQAAMDTPGADLKYAMVAGNVVIVDPIAMRVVDIIPEALQQ